MKRRAIFGLLAGTAFAAALNVVHAAPPAEEELAIELKEIWFNGGPAWGLYYGNARLKFRLNILRGAMALQFASWWAADVILPLYGQPGAERHANLRQIWDILNTKGAAVRPSHGFVALDLPMELFRGDKEGTKRYLCISNRDREWRVRSTHPMMPVMREEIGITIANVKGGTISRTTFVG